MIARPALCVGASRTGSIGSPNAIQSCARRKGIHGSISLSVCSVSDQSGALLIYEVSGEDELREILANDPYTPADVYEIASLQEWEPLFPVKPV